MSLIDELLKQGSNTSPVNAHPKNWEPGYTLGNKSGHAIVRRRAEDPVPDWKDILKEFGLDPEIFTIVGSVNVRTWDANMGSGKVQRFMYYKADVALRENDPVDVQQLCAELKKWKRKKQFTSPAAATLVVCVADLQIGKGTQVVVDRFHESIENILFEAKQLRKRYPALNDLLILGLGDIIEGCDGHYEMQTFQVDLDRRSQVKLARRMLVSGIKRLAEEFDNVRVAAVAGNHGENRKEGKAFTTFADNDDVAVFEQVAEIFEASGDERIEFFIPEDELSIVLPIHGKTIGITHGHLAKGGATASEKLWKWWMGQSQGRQPVGNADVLVAGHYHTFYTLQQGSRTLVGAPSIEYGSDWYRNMSGMGSMPGMLCFVMNEDGPNHFVVV